MSDLDLVIIGADEAANKRAGKANSFYIACLDNSLGMYNTNIKLENDQVVATQPLKPAPGSLFFFIKHLNVHEF